jgi:hypothetical protein
MWWSYSREVEESVRRSRLGLEGGGKESACSSIEREYGGVFDHSNHEGMIQIYLKLMALMWE